MSEARKKRREVARRTAKDVRDRDRLARLQPGGSPELPIEVASASVVEVHAKSMTCPLCGGTLRIEEHTAERGLRAAKVMCTTCGSKRTIWFRLRMLQ